MGAVMRLAMVFWPFTVIILFWALFWFSFGFLTGAILM